MFRNWGFLLGEIWVLLALAALLGLFVGWLIWGRATRVTGDDLASDGLRRALADCEARARAQASRMATLEAGMRSDATPAVAAAAATAAATAPVQLVRPARLDAPKGGKPDDLKLIKGVGPKLEDLCHALGFYHFEQIANWTDAEIAWVDENLEGFKGRVSRDEWVKQARDLAAGLPPLPGAAG